MPVVTYIGHARTADASFRSAAIESGAIEADRTRLHAAAVDRAFVDRRRATPVCPGNQASKRAFDLVLALTLILVLAPLLLFIMFVIQLDGGSAFFGHRRIGQNGKPFLCWKFRSMVRDADRVLEELLARDPAARAEWEENFKLKRDPRITRIGRFLRTTSLDELPQLFNVICGEMSLVGPRPIVAAEVPRYGAAFHDYTRCRPGITGVWQVSGRNDTGYAERVQLDQDYARRWSLATDVAVLWQTFFVVIKRRGAY